MDTRKLLAVAFAGAVITASPADAATGHQFQLKNCNSYKNAWTWNVYNAEDSVDLTPYMTIDFNAVGQTKSGKCKGGGDGYCKVENAQFTAIQFHARTTKTVYGDSGAIREYSGLLDCANEPAH